MNDVVNGFNRFFVNVGPNLASKIPDPLQAEEWNQYKDVFVDKLVCISVTLSVTSAACECMFSCLRWLKTYLRNSSGEARTSNLGVLAISSRRTKGLDIDAVI
ncbi:hypothetical protein N1851_000041 [Merluccius polli]|uniref:HAT C-terminal dimerisation domain-containing protein n=1 Tax=Merluccius polli TaxID=89951 RepID=A0AA47NE24_MERPO|nr:hypothetical protein N1851_000041 [Merluccius polli]